MTFLKKPFVAVASVILAVVGHFAVADVDQAVAKKIKETLATGNPNANFGEVRESAVDGLYEVEVSGGNVLFVSKDGRHFIAGDLFEVTPERVVNLSDQRRGVARASVMEGLDLEDMIVYSPKGKAKAHVYVFTDVDCGYCQKLHNDVPELNRRGIEVRYLAFPRAGLNSVGYRKIATAWCADDPNKTLTDLKNRKQVPLKVCSNNPVADQYKLGNEAIDVRGTPTIVMQDGTVVPGYVPPATLAKALGI